MGRYVTTLAAAAVLALALGVTPVTAHDEALHWVVVESTTTDITGLGPIDCGSNTYEVTSGSSEFVWKMRGAVDDGIALTAGRALETWRLVDALVEDQDGATYRVVGSQRFEASWSAGADLTGAGPFDGQHLIVSIQVEGTTDGHKMAMHQLADGSIRGSDTGTCAGLTFYQD